MTIIEAIKSGKKFRRLTMDCWIEAPTKDEMKDSFIVYKDIGERWTPTFESLLADDWEIESGLNK